MSTGEPCRFVEKSPGAWYYTIGEEGRESTAGPFPYYEAAVEHMTKHHANPGGWITDTYPRKGRPKRPHIRTSVRGKEFRAGHGAPKEHIGKVQTHGKIASLRVVNPDGDIWYFLKLARLGKPSITKYGYANGMWMGPGKDKVYPDGVGAIIKINKSVNDWYAMITNAKTGGLVCECGQSIAQFFGREEAIRFPTREEADTFVKDLIKENNTLVNILEHQEKKEKLEMRQMAAYYRGAPNDRT